MPPAVIPNPILNTPYDEPTRHFRFGDEGITDELVDERRRSAYFIPIAWRTLGTRSNWFGRRCAVDSSHLNRRRREA